MKPTDLNIGLFIKRTGYILESIGINFDVENTLASLYRQLEHSRINIFRSITTNLVKLSLASNSRSFVFRQPYSKSVISSTRLKSWGWHTFLPGKLCSSPLPFESVAHPCIGSPSVFDASKSFNASKNKWTNVVPGV